VLYCLVACPHCPLKRTLHARRMQVWSQQFCSCLVSTAGGCGRRCVPLKPSSRDDLSLELGRRWARWMDMPLDYARDVTAGFAFRTSELSRLWHSKLMGASRPFGIYAPYDLPLTPSGRLEMLTLVVATGAPPAVTSVNL